MAWPRLRRTLLAASIAGAGMAAPVSAAILFQQAVDPVKGVATFSRDWISTNPSIVWIGIDSGRLTSAEAGIGADYTGLFWQDVPDYSEAGSHPELFGENYFTDSRCTSSIGNSYCAEKFFDQTVLITRMNASLFEIDWKGYKSFNRCNPFNGVFDTVCAAGAFEYDGNSYRLLANATERVTFTIYDADPSGGAIPEPSVWVLMISGFGLVGAALRRRRGYRPGLDAPIN